MYELWLSKVKDPETGKFYSQRDKDGNIIKGTKPQQIVKQIVRIRIGDREEYVFSNGYIVGYDIMGEPVREICSSPETWTRTEFSFKREYDPKTVSIKSIPIGPVHAETIYEMPFNEINLKALYDKRITPETLRLLRQTRIKDVSFCLKNNQNGVVREVKDPTGITSKTLELFSTKPFDYLYNGDYISLAQKAELRQQAIDLGILPPVQVSGTGQEDKLAKPCIGTYT